MIKILSQSKTNQMQEKIKQQIKDLQWALQNKLISVNDYSTMYLTLSIKLKQINNQNQAK